MTSGDELKATRDARGRRMAVVRAAFVSEVEQSPARRALRELLRPVDEAVLRYELASWLSEALLGRRMQEKALRNVLFRGRFKTQAEIGSPNPTRSPELERAVWTIDSDDPADRPIYGYAATLCDVRGIDGGTATLRTLSETYGPARVIFKADLRPRTTFTVHDSLSRLGYRAVAPSPVDAPSHLSWPNDGDFERQDIDRCAADEFVEIQILGRVYADDIEQILFDREPEDKTKAALENYIPYEIRRTVPCCQSP